MSKSAPQPPDYVGAAQAQGQSSLQQTELQTTANRPNINTPFGSQSWQMTPTKDPVTGQTVGQWTQNTQLTPEMQAALEKQQGITGEQSDIASTLLGQERSQESTPINYGDMLKVGGFNGDPRQYDKGAADAAFNEYLGYNQPLQKQATEQMDTQLRNQGLAPGDQAYDTAMTNLRNQQSQSTQQAENEAVLTGSQIGQQQFGSSLSEAGFNNQAAQAQMAQEMQKRGFTLNQIDAILSGNQVNLPQTPGFATAGSSQPVQSLTAAEAAGNAANTAFGIQQQGVAGAEAGAGTTMMALAVLF